ncbi:MAG TPA: site-specific integrase [Nitrosopumilaceae archaeon]|nr:site-specific integrase [Nitrosopumilaceae archaeon]
MSYLETRISREEFIKTRGAKNSQNSAKLALNLFDYFCQDQFKKTGDGIILEIQKAVKIDQNFDRLFRLCNSFVQWLQEDQPQVIIHMRGYNSHIKKHTPQSIKMRLSYTRQYMEDFGQMEFSERRFQKMVRLPKDVHEELEPFSKDEIRAFVDASSPKRKALYMTLKDSGMRIGEAVQLKKRDINMTLNPVTITVHANYAKTKRGRTTFLTRETKRFLLPILAKIEDEDLVFGSNKDPMKAATNEGKLFDYLRKNLGFTQKYESNNRHKKNLHSLRAYCATQLSEIYGEEFAHGFIGHAKYLGQYIRNKDKLAEKYLRAENNLMIYEQVEVVDQSLTIAEAKAELREEMAEEFRKDREELTRLIQDKNEIQKLL